MKNTAKKILSFAFVLLFAFLCVVPGYAESVTDSENGAAQGEPDLIQKIKDTGVSIGNSVVILIRKANSAVNNIITTVGNTITNIKTAIVNFVDGIMLGINGAIAKGKQFFTEDLGNYFADFANNGQKTLTKVGDSVANAFVKFEEGTKGLFGDLFHSASDSAKETVSTAVGDANTSLGKIIGVFEKIGAAVVSAFDWISGYVMTAYDFAYKVIAPYWWAAAALGALLVGFFIFLAIRSGLKRRKRLEALIEKEQKEQKEQETDGPLPEQVIPPLPDSDRWEDLLNAIAEARNSVSDAISAIDDTLDSFSPQTQP